MIAGDYYRKFNEFGGQSPENIKRGGEEGIAK